jgi:hypothetical protein
LACCASEQVVIPSNFIAARRHCMLFKSMLQTKPIKLLLLCNSGGGGSSSSRNNGGGRDSSSKIKKSKASYPLNRPWRSIGL